MSLESSRASWSKLESGTEYHTDDDLENCQVSHFGTSPPESRFGDALPVSCSNKVPERSVRRRRRKRSKEHRHTQTANAGTVRPWCSGLHGRYEGMCEQETEARAGSDPSDQVISWGVLIECRPDGFSDVCCVLWVDRIVLRRRGKLSHWRG